MGRKMTGWWDEARGVWYARIGEPSPKNGKLRPVVLRDESGEPVARGDEAGRDAAIHRVLAERAGKHGPTVAQVINAYVMWHHREGSAPRTIKGHHYHLKRFAEFRHQGVSYAGRPAESIVPGDLWRFKRSGLGAMRQAYMSILACWQWASVPIEGREPEVMIPSNSLAGVKRPRRGPPSGVMEWSDSRRMLRLARGWARKRARTRRARTRWSRWLLVQSLALIAYGGPRTAEAVTLEWGDIHWDEGVAVIPRGRHKTGSRTQKDRHFPIGRRMLRVLREIERHPDRHPVYVFSSRWATGPTPREFWRRIRLDLKPALAAMGMELPAGWKPYWLRHGLGTTAMEAVGADMAASALGHSPEVLKSTYDHVTLRRVREVGEAVERARKKRG